MKNITQCRWFPPRKDGKRKKNVGGTGSEPNHLKGNAITKLEHMRNFVQRSRSATPVFRENSSDTGFNRPRQREPTVIELILATPEPKLTRIEKRKIKKSSANYSMKTSPK